MYLSTSVLILFTFKRNIPWRDCSFSTKSYCLLVRTYRVQRTNDTTQITPVIFRVLRQIQRQREYTISGRECFSCDFEIIKMFSKQNRHSFRTN